jgi:enhancing lycopene biosynthesis protein 2
MIHEQSEKICRLFYRAAVNSMSSEIHEAVIILRNNLNGCSYQYLVIHTHSITINHTNGKITNEYPKCNVETARIYEREQ